MALTPAVVDVPLTPLNQVPSDTMGPLGRLKHLIDTQIKKYEPHYVGAGGVVPAKVKVEPRDAFVSLPSAARSVVDGTVAGPQWTPVELLNSLGEQLVAIDNATPRVFGGSTWASYPTTRTLTNKLSDDVFHTSQHTIQAPDSAWLAGVTCSVWTESVVTAAGQLTTSYVGFKSDAGAWLVVPTALFASASVVSLTNARVVQDGTNFWVFHSTTVSGVVVGVYDIHGALLNTFSNITPSLHEFSSADWDVIATPSAGGYTVLAAVITDGTSNAGVTLTALKLNGSTVDQNAVAVPSINANLGISFLTNDTGNGLSYLATALTGSPEAIWAYEISNQSVSHTYDTGVVTSSGTIDSLAGYAVNSGGVNVVISYSLLALSSSTGPKYDPQRRSMTSFVALRSGGNTPIRTTQSLCQVSRAFAVDGEYYVYGYYQSGSGLNVTPTKVNVTIEAGDYMVGAETQPIVVRASDVVFGSPADVTEAAGTSGAVTVFVSSAKTSTAVLAGDSASARSALNASQYGIPDGTPLILWTLANLTAGTNNYGGSRLTITGLTGTGVPFNSTFEVLGGLNSSLGSTQFYTLAQDTYGNPVSTTTFGSGGSFVMTSMVCYLVSDLSTFVPSDAVARGVFVESNGTIVVSGASGSGNNGTFQIQRIRSPLGSAGSSAAWPASPAGINPIYTFGNALNATTTSQVWVTHVSQTQETVGAGFTAVVNPSSTPNNWFFSNGAFDSTYVGADLVVSADPALPSNVGTYPITAVTAANDLVTGDATAITSQFFTFPFPTVAIQLTTQNACTFKLQAVTPDYTYQNAIVSVQGAADPNNNGTYQITQIKADGTFIAYPTNGLSNQVNEAFTGAQTITIFLDPNVGPEFQPTWFMVPLIGSQPVVGRFEYGLAYADWRVEGDSIYGGNLFPMAISSPCATTIGSQICLPYRAQNITSATREVTAAGQVDIGVSSFESTVGLKVFLLESSPGKSFSNSGELLIPGPMATVFTPSGFREDNFNLALEAPFLVSQSVGAAGTLGLTPGATYFYVAVGEATDENGNRIFSPPSPALQVSMSGTNNVATLGGRVTFPTSSTGDSVASTFGPTTRQATISLYRTAWINGVPTTQRYKITTDLNPNGLAPISDVNPSGFSFPDTFTWNYIDQNDDANLNASEILYVDKGYLPRYPAPAFVGGVGSWKNREWVIGYDGAIWMSGEKTEGDAIWFNPLFRYVLPTDDKPKTLAALEDYLLIFCERSIWYIPSSQFPDATGANGGLPTPVQLPFPNGSANGFAVSIRDGVAYDSSAGGCWMITRALDNVWLGEPVVDTLTGTITGMTVDEDQRLFVQQSGSPVICVYDRVPQAWYEWRCPTQGLLLATYRGQACYQDTAVVAVVTPGGTADSVNGTTTGIAPDITLAPLNIGNVRGLKRVWEFQLVGTYLGPHRMNIVLSYPEDDVADTTYDPFTPAADEPYVLPFNPKQETASQFGIRLYVDFVGIGSPGLSCSLEVISAQVGMEPIGLSKRPTFVTLVAKR